MRKFIIIICLSAMIGLTIMPGAFSYWNKTISINGNIDTRP